GFAGYGVSRSPLYLVAFGDNLKSCEPPAPASPATESLVLRIWGEALVSPAPFFPSIAAKREPGRLPDSLLDDLGYHPRANRSAALANGEPQLGVHCDRLDQLDLHLRIVTRHHHRRPLRQLHYSGDVSGAEVEPWPVAVDEGRLTTAF